MMIRRVSTVFVALAMSVTCLHATTVSGVIHFTGLVYRPASASIAFHASEPQAQKSTVRVYSLDEAVNKLHSDVLDYFATYAPKDSTVVSATYE